MTSDEREEILGYLKAIKVFLGFIGSGFLASVFVFAWFIITDHFDQNQLRQDMAYVKPKVEKLWWKTFPESSKANSLFNYQMEYVMRLHNTGQAE